MKTTLLILPATLIAISAFAVSPPAAVISQTPSSENATSGQSAGSVAITNQSGQAISSQEIQNQLSELRRVIEETTPVINSVTQSYSNSAAAKPNVVGGIANVLGGLLNRNTNSATGQASSSSTNALGRILQGVVGAATTNAAPASSAEFRDLVSLQEHLQATLPILQRLGVSTNMTAPSAIGGTRDESETETGQGRGSKSEDND